MARAAEAATVEKLTTEPPEFNASENTIKQMLIKELRRTVKELFHGHRYTTKHQMRNFFPSTNSNYINTRSKFGALRTVLAKVEELKLREPSNDHRVIFSKVDNDGDEIMNEDEPSYHVIYDDTRLQHKYTTLFRELERESKYEVANVKTVGLEEPLKVRVITAGPPYTYTVLKPYQKFLHDILRKHPVFQLLGNPVPTPEMLYSQGLDEMGPGEAMNSGDYDDATNEMFSWVSEVVAKQLAAETKLDADTKEKLLKALIGHVLYGKDQLHGSLMGSIVNFIILCVSNAALCRVTMELDSGKTVSLEDARLLINGDDCLFPLTKNGVETWTMLGNVMGLKVNKAKSFW
jgi:hypothetical protein